VLGELVKRLLNLAVLALAALAFFRVPLGRRTPAEHVAAIFATPPAREAASALADAAAHLGERVAAEVERARASGADKPAAAPPK
jgi:hypothetical protein